MRRFTQVLQPRHLYDGFAKEWQDRRLRRREHRPDIRAERGGYLPVPAGTNGVAQRDRRSSGLSGRATRDLDNPTTPAFYLVCICTQMVD